MNSALLVHDSLTNGIPSSENQFVVGCMYKSVDHGELLVVRQYNDLGSRGGTQGGMRFTGSGGLWSHGGGRRGIEFSLRSRECFPYEKMGITQFLESDP